VSIRPDKDQEKNGVLYGIELTDGGHFENLGLYELVRRKLPIIVIVDGEADPSISLASLVSATRRIEQDFGATLTFDDTFGKGPERLMMYQQKGYPAGFRYASCARAARRGSSYDRHFSAASSFHIGVSRGRRCLIAQKW
jgi:hypothetical protein